MTFLLVPALLIGLAMPPASARSSAARPDSLPTSPDNHPAQLLASPVTNQARPNAARPNAARPNVDLDQLLQRLFPVQIEGIDYQQVFDALAQLYANPIDLNTATHDDLAATYLLDERQLTGLLNYRTNYGNLLSVYELQAVPELDLPTIRRLIPFVTVRADAHLFGALPTPTDHYLLVRYQQVLEERKGFSPGEPDKKGKLPTRYLGDAGQWFMRYRYSRPNQFSMGLTVAKDAGETRWRWNPAGYQYGPDFVSFHVQRQQRGRWRNVILGDYQLQIGQGLVLSAGFVLGKSAEVVQTVRRPTLGARPYTSQTEAGFFRGAAVTYALHPKLELTLMASRLRRDANTLPGSSTLTTDDDIASSLQTSGYHRTPSELADRASLAEQDLAAHVLFQPNRNLQIGATTLLTRFSLPYQKANQPYNQYEFSGTQNRVIGLHAGYVWQNANFFGEVAHSSGSVTNGGGMGAVAGVLASLTQRFDLAVLLRHYDRNFHSFYSNAFSESSRNSNETGFYTGIKYTIYRRLTATGYVDVFRFPWWKYLVDAPTAGFDFLGRISYTPNRRTTFYAVYHEEHKRKNRPGSKLTPREVVGTTRRTLALNADYTPLPGLTLRSRVQVGRFAYAGLDASRGFTVFQDADYGWKRWSVSGRVALFGTDDYDARQYAYERDVLYAFSFPAYFNRGIRHYLLVQYTASRHLDLWLRWARTDQMAPATIGSDLDLISVPHRSEVKVQARWRF